VATQKLTWKEIRKCMQGARFAYSVATVYKLFDMFCIAISSFPAKIKELSLLYLSEDVEFDGSHDICYLKRLKLRKSLRGGGKYQRIWAVLACNASEKDSLLISSADEKCRLPRPGRTV